SSRRRHTRFSRDWSSDVCSSDLIHLMTISAVLDEATMAPRPAPTSTICTPYPNCWPAMVGRDLRTPYRRPLLMELTAPAPGETLIIRAATRNVNHTVSVIADAREIQGSDIIRAVRAQPIEEVPRRPEKRRKPHSTVPCRGN